MDFVPYGWKPEAKAAFKAYIEEGQGGWVGLHHATLLGNFDGQPMWPWFSEFMGKIKYQNYIPTFVSGTVRVEDKAHPCMKGLPETFAIAKRNGTSTTGVRAPMFACWPVWMNPPIRLLQPS